VYSDGRPNETIVGGIECSCEKAYCTNCAKLAVRDECCIDCLTIPPVSAAEAAALSAAVACLADSTLSLKEPTLLRAARWGLIKACPHPEDSRAVFAGQRESECSLCGMVYRSEAVPA
jgi:hypothetical protein